MANPIRVGIVGVGWGALVHVPAFRAVEIFEVVALCSRRRQSVSAAGERVGITDVSTNWRSFVRRDDLDLISVTAPADQHVDICLAALAAGKHVLCEKPIALDAASALDLAQAGEETALATAMGFELPWVPPLYSLWQLVDAGYVGAPYFVRHRRNGSYWHPSHKPMSPWMYRRDQGGGFLMGSQSHTINFITKLFGDAVSICADVRTTIPRLEMADGAVVDIDADDTSNLLLRLASGVSAVLSTSMVGAHMDSEPEMMELFGSAGTITLDGDVLLAGSAVDEGLTAHAIESRELESGVLLPNPGSFTHKMVHATALMLEEWRPAFIGQPTPRVPSLRDGWRVQRIIDAARESSDGAGWVELD